MSEERVRRVTAQEWEQVRALRLQALDDAAASIAFLETRENAAECPDDFWIARTEAAAVSDTVAQFVVDRDGVWIGTLSVLVREDGTLDHLRHVVQGRRADVVGVYIHPDERGRGLLNALVEEAAAWTRALGFDALFLDVHADNDRAQGAYARAGFEPTGVRFTGPIGDEFQMSRPLR